jgi:hypothetical protein
VLLLFGVALAACAGGVDVESVIFFSDSLNGAGETRLARGEDAWGIL